MVTGSACSLVGRIHVNHIACLNRRENFPKIQRREYRLSPKKHGHKHNVRLHSIRTGSQSTLVGALVEAAVTVVAHGTLYTSGKQIKQEFRIARSVELIANGIVVFQMVCMSIMPYGSVEIRNFFGFIYNQRKKLGQRVIQIIQPIFSTSAISGAGEGNRPGASKRLDQARHLARHQVKDSRGEPTLASLILEWLRNIHTSSFMNAFCSAKSAILKVVQVKFVLGRIRMRDRKLDPVEACLELPADCRRIRANLHMLSFQFEQSHLFSRFATFLATAYVIRQSCEFTESRLIHYVMISKCSPSRSNGVVGQG